MGLGALPWDGNSWCCGWQRGGKSRSARRILTGPANSLQLHQGCPVKKTQVGVRGATLSFLGNFICFYYFLISPPLVFASEDSRCFMGGSDVVIPWCS